VKTSDRDLGMRRPITRRDFLNGVAAVTAGVLAPGCRQDAPAPGGPHDLPVGELDPPLRTGMRGSHPGSFEVAHELGRVGPTAGPTEWGTTREGDDGAYDLVVVGAGISGLAAAHFYREAHPKARILVLDNHDDFGGHARRNEFRVGGQTVLGHAGSQTLQEPSLYSEVTRRLLRDLGVDLRRLAALYHHDFFRRRRLVGATYFDGRTYGADRLVRYPLLDYSEFLPLAPSPITANEAVAAMPLGANAKRELLGLLETRENRLPEVPVAQQQQFLWRLSYRDFLMKYLGVTDPEVFDLFQGLTTDSGTSIEAGPAFGLMTYIGLPGIKATGLPDHKALEEPYAHHFPDGNASIARLLVRGLVPRVAPGSTMEDVVEARFDYSRLDEPDSGTRLRLSSMVVRVEHDGSPQTAQRVGVTYVHRGQSHRVWSRAVVLAGYNSMIRHICPELPTRQREALALSVKTPLVYTNVAVRSWSAWQKLGIGFVAAPASYHAVTFLDYPTSIGGYEHARDPGQPIVIHMERFPKGTNPAASRHDQHRAGRYEMLAESFEAIERETRLQLGGILSAGGFDPPRDIAAIAVNRWPHGYANWSSPLSGEGADGEPAHVVGRSRLGRIAIANSDAGASATLDTAIDQAHRAIEELA